MSVANDLREKLSNNTGIIKAAIYARVSTDTEGQKDSCSNQVDYAIRYIKKHPNIQLIGVYVDDGVSGKNDFTRPKYNEMFHEITEGNVDLIITKALSRLNRDEYNSFVLKNKLLEMEATVLTLEDNQVHDFEDLNSGIMQSLTFAIDAQYVKRQSLSGKRVHQQRCERKELTAKDCKCLGFIWNKDTKTITINDEEAEVVRKIFEEYVYRNGTPADIERTLKSEGINVRSCTIKNIIRNERYIGNFYINKWEGKLGTGNMKSRKYKLPEDEWILVERPELQIVDKELFEMAKRIHETRVTVHEKPGKKAVQARFRGHHKYASKVFCPVCGKAYQFGYADRAKTKPIYQIRKHSECSNPFRRISESDLDEIIRQALKRTIDQQEEVCRALEETLIECIESSQDSDKDIAKLKQRIKTKENQMNNLIDELVDDGLVDIAKKRIKTKINEISEEIEQLLNDINDKETNKVSVSYVSDKVDKIKAAIADLRNFNVIDRDMILNYIDRIEIPESGDVNILLKSGQIINMEANKNGDFSGGENVFKKVKQGTAVPCQQAMETMYKICLNDLKSSLHLLN